MQQIANIPMEYMCITHTKMTIQIILNHLRMIQTFMIYKNHPKIFHKFIDLHEENAFNILL